MKNRKLILFLILISCISSAYTQNINAWVADAKELRKLAFVSIVFDDGRNGTSSDIDGKFTIDIQKTKNLRFSYVGYYDTIISVENLKNSGNIVFLQAKTFELEEVIIYPGENPAHRIILKTLENRNRNNPEKLHSFRYSAYHKMIFTADIDKKKSNDSIISNQSLVGFYATLGNSTDSTNLDSLNKKMKDLFENQHIMLMESVSKRVFKEGKNYEKIVAAKISGFDDPLLVTIAQSTQSFSFYGNRVALWDKFYVNPISPGSISKYFFQIQDTIYKDLDTVFILSFRPMKGTNFDGLKGLLYINSHSYAIQNVIAEPAKKNKSLSIRIQQLYEKVGDSVWFPMQLNTDLIFKTTTINNLPMIGIGRSYLTEIEVNKEIKNSEFGNVDLEILPDAMKKNSVFWQENRTDSLSVRDSNTYVFMESANIKSYLNFYNKFLKTMLKGYVSWGWFDFDLNKIATYNLYEKWKLGLGVQNSDKISENIKLGLYGAWLSGQNNPVYGVDFKVRFPLTFQTEVGLKYYVDNKESAALKSFEKSIWSSADLYRYLLIQNMFQQEMSKFWFENKSIRYLRLNVEVNYSKNEDVHNSIFSEKYSNVNIYRSAFYNAESVISLRYAFREKIVRTGSMDFNQGTKFPLFYISWTHGFSGIRFSEFDYNKFEVQIEKTQNTNYLGKTKLVIKAGFTDRSIPWIMQFSAPASFANFYLESPNSFNTMNQLEFLSDQYVYVFFRHNFEKLLFQSKYFSPGIELVTNIGFGKLQQNDIRQNLNFKTMEKGFFESGILVHQLMKSSLNSLGLGVFYRYGAYSFPSIKENFVFKITNTYNL